MPQLLLTGFQPWGDHQSNAASAILAALDLDLPPNWSVSKREIPVSWKKAPQIIHDCLSCKPAVYIAFGQYSGETVRIETTAKNQANPTSPDVDGRLYPSKTIDASSPDSLPSRLPTTAILAELKKHEIPATLSNDAGDYLCNFLFYHQLAAIEKSQAPVSAGFIHIPLLSQWPLDTQIAAANIVIETTLNAFEASQS